MRWGENSEVIVGYLYHHQRRSRFDKTLGKKETLETCVLAAYTERHSPGMCSSSQVLFQVLSEATRTRHTDSLLPSWSLHLFSARNGQNAKAK